ncbi:MAG TPA: hypothetical protein DHV25_00320 [Candidatus Kerfeldbacteria bacterium]|uniref:Uncharacterized protein n=1 Tax=Candidatus Kaiserbacteria bacterium GW2011_GWA2_52_12 TaxID=1618671 RepID=A0A0G1WWJ9_9BACT|nr:MAG: hypothetical protein UY67_C0032G0012 [Candidatus Kaiserbacteria bacterium GW2011_GWA2_52_12]HCJ52152.1 hypothetical protein [Candidatus Kerfeldbacteria bacterium]
MGRVITQNESMAQVELYDGERVLISFKKDEVAIFKLGFFGFIPLYKVWSSSLDLSSSATPVTVKLWMHSFDPVQAAIAEVLPSRSIEDLKQWLNKRG